MDKNSINFYLSGFISFTLFSFVFLLFVLVLFKPVSIDSYALKKDNFISISLEIPELPMTTPKKNQATKLESQSAVPVEKNIDINNLFSDVWTKNIKATKKPPKEHTNRRLLQMQKKIRITNDNDVKSISQKLNDFETSKTHEKSKSSSTATEVNEYLAKIQAIVYQYFKVPANSEGSSVKTVIELNALGKVLDFRVLSYSTNSALNEEADKIRERLMSVVFPVNPQNRSSRTIVILISKG